jgi:hypothetical protein
MDAKAIIILTHLLSHNRYCYGSWQLDDGKGEALRGGVSTMGGGGALSSKKPQRARASPYVFPWETQTNLGQLALFHLRTARVKSYEIGPVRSAHVSLAL